MNGQNLKAGPDSGIGHEPLQGSRPGRLERLAWLPILLLAAAIIVGRAADPSESYTSEPLRLVLSFVFYTLVPLGTLLLIGRGFLALGTPGLLFLECGVVLWSLAGTVGDVVSHGDANVDVTIFNICILLAGVCHLAGAILSLRPQRRLRAPILWLVTGCALALGALWLITQTTLAAWFPVFFIQGHGGTPVRYCVLISAISMFVLSACLLLAGRRGTHLPFTSWYAFALLLLAVGLFGMMIQLSLFSVVNWLSRTAQWLAGVYLLLSAVNALRSSHLPLFPPENKSRPTLYRDAVAMVIVLAAAAVRLTFLPALGTRAPFITFFPAVMLAALYGGWRAGLLATALSAVLVDYFWIEPLGRFAIAEPADWLGLAIFFLGSCMIAWIVETLHQTRTRAFAAETRALLAAEREAAAQLLRKSEERYHTLFTGMTEGFAIHELLTDESGRPVDYRFLDVNPAFERLTGLERQDVVGGTHNEVLPGDDPEWLQMYGHVALTGQPVQFEKYSSVLKRHYEVLAYNPAPMQFAVIFMDITERKRAEKMLMEAKSEAERHAAEMAALMDAVPVAVFIAHDVECRRMSGSRFTQELLGLPATANFSKSAPPSERPADFKAMKDGVEIPADELPVQMAAKGREIHDYEFELLFDDGKSRHLLGDATPLRNAEGRIYGSVGAFVDMTGRKRAEEELHKAKEEAERRARELEALMDAVPALIWVARDTECLSMTGNRAVYEFLGMPYGANVSKTAHETERPVHFRALRNGREILLDELPMQRAAKGEGMQDYELEYAFDDGASRITLGNTTPLYDAAGHVYGAIAAFVDITERKLMEEELRKSREELELRVQERTAELESANKNLRQVPSLLIEAQENERNRLAMELHDSIGQTIAALKFRIEHVIITLERHESALALHSLREFIPILQRSLDETRAIYMGLKPIILSDHGVLSTLQWHRKELLRLYPDQHIELETSIGEEDIPEVLKTPIFRIVQEALNNSHKHSKAEWVDVRIALNDGAIELEISDDGVGMDLDYILESLTAKSLGLVGMRERVELTGGAFTIESTPGEGTTIFCVWPKVMLGSVLDSDGGIQ